MYLPHIFIVLSKYIAFHWSVHSFGIFHHIWRSLLRPSTVQSWNINLYGIISMKTNLKQHHCGELNLLFQWKTINTTVMSYLCNYSHIFNEFHTSKFVLVLNTVNYIMTVLHLWLNDINVLWIKNIFQTTLFYS